MQTFTLIKSSMKKNKRKKNWLPTVRGKSDVVLCQLPGAGNVCDKNIEIEHKCNIDALEF